MGHSLTMKAACAALLVAAAYAARPTQLDETSVEFLSVSEMVQADSPKGNVTIYGDMNVQGSLRTTSIQSSNLTVDGSLNVTADLKASKLKVDNLHADSVETMVRSCFRYGLLPQRFFLFLFQQLEMLAVS